MNESDARSQGADYGSSYTELPSLKQIGNLSIDVYLRREKLPGNAQCA
jgi:hypothetical protein